MFGGTVSRRTEKCSTRISKHGHHLAVGGLTIRTTQAQLSSDARGFHIGGGTLSPSCQP